MEHGAFARNDPMSAAFPQGGEYRVEERVLELLRQENARITEMPDPDPHPLEVAVMIAAEDHRFSGLERFEPDVEVLHLDVARKIFLCQTRAPHEVDHGPGEMLVGFADDLLSAGLRQGIAKSELEILQRDAASMPVQNRGESTDELRELITGFSGKERHDCACSF